MIKNRNKSSQKATEARELLRKVERLTGLSTSQAFKLINACDIDIESSDKQIIKLAN